jgi:uncharacterized membrane protein YoaK (UPF0700 family)
MTESVPERGLPLPWVLLALTVVSGIIDAVSYLAFGHVFTANMTGNVVVLGFAAAQAHGFSALHALVSLGAFLLGAGLGGWVANRLGRRSRRRWVRLVLLVEALLLGASALVAGVGTGSRAVTVYVLIAVTAVAMGVRNATVVKLGIADLTTTVLTRTLTGLASDSPLGDRTRFLRRAGSVVALCLGALVGAVLVLRWGSWLPLLIAAAVPGVLALMASGRA